MIYMVNSFLSVVGVFFLLYLLIYSTYLLSTVLFGAAGLYQRSRRIKIRNELKHDYYVPVSILVPAYNEAVTIVDSIKSLLDLEYRLFEIIIIDDGSIDDTAKKVIEEFGLLETERPIRMRIKCKAAKKLYEGTAGKTRITLISKENGGKGDALNMGINASEYPYFLCIDADSMLQYDSLEKIVQPVLESDEVVAVGGLIRIEQCIILENGRVMGYRLPWHPVIGMQVMEYDRSFLASRMLMDKYNGNLIISGAFGLFKKEIVVACGGYAPDTVGEDMELVVKMHVFCSNNNIPYNIKYEPNAICWSQAPTTLRDLIRQRRRWYTGLIQAMMKFRQMFGRMRFGAAGTLSYSYYLLYELLSPVIELLGIVSIAVALWAGLLNISFMISFLLLYILFGVILTMTAFFQRIYTQGLRIKRSDVVRSVYMCMLETLFFSFILAFTRMLALLGYRRNRSKWGSIKRTKMNEDALTYNKGTQES